MEEKKKEIQILNDKTMESLKQERSRVLAANEVIENQLADDTHSFDAPDDGVLQEKPAMSIFKAIFADSDEEGEESQPVTRNIWC